MVKAVLEAIGEKPAALLVECVNQVTRPTMLLARTHADLLILCSNL